MPLVKSPPEREIALSPADVGVEGGSLLEWWIQMAGGLRAFEVSTVATSSQTSSFGSGKPCVKPERAQNLKKAHETLKEKMKR